jgi:hypothetical protein
MPRDPQGLAYQEQRVIDFLLRHLRG